MLSDESYSATELNELSGECKGVVGIYNSIEETYNYIKSCPDPELPKNSIKDICHYMEILRGYAEKCDHITEFGINQVNSTWAFLVTKPKKLVSVDKDLHHNPIKDGGIIPEECKYDNVKTNVWLDSASELAAIENIDFEVIEGWTADAHTASLLADIPVDTIPVVIEQTDLLFIDTLHTYDCLSRELELHGDKVNKYIIFHDTVLFSGIVPAIDEFLENNKEWKRDRVEHSTPGLTVIKKDTSPPKLQWWEK